MGLQREPRGIVEYARNHEDRIRRLELRERGASEFNALTPDEGWDADYLYGGYYTFGGFVHFTGIMVWRGPDALIDPLSDEDAYSPDNDAVNLFTDDVDALGGTDYAYQPLPSAIWPVRNEYITTYSLGQLGDTGLSGNVKYEMYVTQTGNWTVLEAFSSGYGRPVDTWGRTHHQGVALRQYVTLNGLSWRIAD